MLQSLRQQRVVSVGTGIGRQLATRHLLCGQVERLVDGALAGRATLQQRRLLLPGLAVTAAGRLVGFCTMLLSIGVVAIPAGIFSAGFVSEFRAQDARDRLDADALQGGFDERAAEGGPAEGGEADRDA